MTKQLQELFNLPDAQLSDEEIIDETEESLDIPSDITTTALTTLEKIEESLPRIRGLEAADSELDELSNLAINSYKDLMELGMQVDSRFSSEIFAVGSTMLGHAITAKTAKINKKLKMLDLQIKKVALDQKQAQIDAKNSEKEAELNATPLGSGKAFDRNELLKMFSTKDTNK